MSTVRNQVEEIYRIQSRKVFASLVRLLGDFDLAEEAMQEAFAAAISQWDAEDIPANSSAWLISAGRFKAIDIIRRREKARAIAPEVSRRIQETCEANAERAVAEIEDDQLRLIFTCCHPAIDPKVQVPLTLREVCGLTTEEIAKAFLTSPTTMAQRIVRGKAKIRDARIPFVVPRLSDLPTRLDGVLSVIYLIFNEGYSASRGDSLIRSDLSDEAIRLCRLLLRLHSDAEGMGLLALMLLHESRRSARTSGDGEIVLLEDQDRSLWDQQLISEGKKLVEQSLGSRRFGFYTLQAAISAVHADAPTAAQTDWNQIVALYSVLLQVDPSPVVELNRAVAVAMRDGPEAGIAIIDEVLGRGELRNYHLAHSARGELLRRAGRNVDAIAAFQQALELCQQQPERRFLIDRLRSLRET
ncbi:RNA polymerase, sigma-24 subunit, ECF subfamily [Rhodopirellula maiorica SM1]|uniref:RNA polymerase, sigma-24 subunit, ECF subfamily n=1 Tax=Rhodopirellula maiorica SM1 TaxID=1265738 RepID=M5RJY0_9BACT|nr:RNA polymerase sigma factor [Rhodopirellula maiorica]EMI19633.1 RNA polymerase, sigma-24 subunit, ECF subfamily [Rhodopirellula maiorica SM1]